MAAGSMPSLPKAMVPSLPTAVVPSLPKVVVTLLATAVMTPLTKVARAMPSLVTVVNTVAQLGHSRWLRWVTARALGPGAHSLGALGRVPCGSGGVLSDVLLAHAVRVTPSPARWGQPACQDAILQVLGRSACWYGLASVLVFSPC